MCTIQPFSAFRYATTPAGRNVGTRLAPPYDVLDAADKQALLQRDAHNFVAIDLPHVPPKHAGPPEAYQGAKRLLDAWLAEGALRRDEKPALYVYHQSFEHAGRKFTRKKFFARLRLEPFGQGSVFPHEQTFGGPKEDRLALMKATHAQLSPIFGLYPDSANVVAERLEVSLGEPILEGGLDATENRVWAVTQPDVLKHVTRLMADKQVYIADGHHRYGTAMLYRDWLISQQGALPAEHPANFVLCVLCAMEDAGLLILPTHRVLPKVALSSSALSREAELEIQPLRVARADDVPAALAAHGPQAVGFFSAADNAYCSVRPRNPALLDACEPKHSPAWRRLGLAFLHAWLLDRVITLKHCGGTAPEVHYVKSAAAAVDETRSSSGCAFLMQPTTMKEMSDVCSAGDLMPQKSTFFYPKLASGLIVHSLAP